MFHGIQLGRAIAPTEMDMTRPVFALLPAVIALTLLATRASGQEAIAGRLDYAQQRKIYRTGVQQYPLPRDKHKIEQIFTMRLEDSELEVTPHLEPDRDYQQRRAELERIGEPAVILCWLISQDLNQVQFEFSTDDYSVPGVYGRVHVLARPDHNVEIEKIWQTPRGFRRVRYVQNSTDARLSINSTDDSLNISLTDKDFISLRHNHPAETEHWLRPVFRELHQEAAFAPDAGAAWQVLLDDWPADGRVAARVLPHVKELDGEDWRVRHDASIALRKLGRDGAVAILRMDRRGLSPEQNARLDEVVSRFKPLSDAQARRLRDDPRFLLDCLYCDQATARRLALARLRQVTGKQIAFNLDADADDRMAAIGALSDALFAPIASHQNPK